MLGQRHRRWPNNKPALGEQTLVFAWIKDAHKGSIMLLDVRSMLAEFWCNAADISPTPGHLYPRDLCQLNDSLTRCLSSGTK